MQGKECEGRHQFQLQLEISILFDSKHSKFVLMILAAIFRAPFTRWSMTHSVTYGYLSLLFPQTSFTWNISIWITSRYRWGKMNQWSIVFLLLCCVFLHTKGARPSECELDREVGPCRAMIPMYYFSPASNRCENFFYGGCSGSSFLYPLFACFFRRFRKRKSISQWRRVRKTMFKWHCSLVSKSCLIYPWFRSVYRSLE